MCIFRSDREVVVCDVAIDHVRAELQGYAGTDVTYRAAEEGGTTFVHAAEVVDPEAFGEAVLRGMGRVVVADAAPGQTQPAPSYPETVRPPRRAHRSRALGTVAQVLRHPLPIRRFNLLGSAEASGRRRSLGTLAAGPRFRRCDRKATVPRYDRPCNLLEARWQMVRLAIWIGFGRSWAWWSRRWFPTT